jgi:alpha-D-ribose 1-methylphosphonate 5-triphosphate synthase subunit PhnH
MSDIAEIRPGVGADLARLEPGFADPVQDAQACFRVVLDAMAHPGRIVRMPAGGLPARLPLDLAATSIALSLCDIDTPVWLDAASAAAAGYLTFHCGAPLTKHPGEARFAFIGDAKTLPPLDGFALGSDEYPERSATLVIEIAGLANDRGAVLRGPGIRDAVRLDAAGLPARFWTERATLAELFPRGLDVLLVCGDRLAAVPRSTRVAVQETG